MSFRGYPASTIWNDFCDNFNDDHFARQRRSFFLRTLVNIHTKQFEIVLPGIGKTAILST